MRGKISLLIAGVAAAAVVAGGAYWYSQRQTGGATGSSDFATLATPLGITLQEISGGGGAMAAAAPASAATAQTASGAASATAPTPAKADTGGTYRPAAGFFPGGPLRGARGMAYADINGKSLYTYDKDTEPGKSSCTGDCLNNWPAAVVPAGAKPTGNWSVIARDDGAKQWAFKGKPLYTFAKDSGVGEQKGNGAGGVWHALRFNPAAEVKAPYGIAVEEAVSANAYVLVGSRGMTLYAFGGDPNRYKPNCDKAPCVNHWAPVAAGQLANPIGDFAPVNRDDGVKQWTYKGKALYSFDGDLARGDASGEGIEQGFHVAAIARYFMPAQAIIREDNARGPMLATAQGLTLYRRDTSFHQPDGHGLPHSSPGNPGVGRAIGTKGCDSECLKTWRPFAAPADAVPSGYWDVVARPDGTKQWAYKGFVLYTYVRDKKPGDKTGDDIYDILATDDLHQAVYDQGPVKNTTTASLYWAYAEP